MLLDDNLLHYQACYTNECRLVVFVKLLTWLTKLRHEEWLHEQYSQQSAFSIFNLFSQRDSNVIHNFAELHSSDFVFGLLSLHMKWLVTCCVAAPHSLQYS